MPHSVNNDEDRSHNTISASTTDNFNKGLPADSNAPVILIVGAPGANKSTFGQKIAKKYDGFVHISMGELLRRKVLQNIEDELWSRIGKKIDAGDVIPMVLDAFKNSLFYSFF